MSEEQLVCYNKKQSDEAHYLPEERFGDKASPRLMAFQYVWNHMNGVPNPVLLDGDYRLSRCLIFFLHCISFVDYFQVTQMLPVLDTIITRLLQECTDNREALVLDLNTSLHSQSYSGTLKQWMRSKPEWNIFNGRVCSITDPIQG